MITSANCARSPRPMRTAATRWQSSFSMPHLEQDLAAGRLQRGADQFLETERDEVLVVQGELELDRLERIRVGRIRVC